MKSNQLYSLGIYSSFKIIIFLEESQGAHESSENREVKGIEESMKEQNLNDSSKNEVILSKEIKWLFLKSKGINASDQY